MRRCSFPGNPEREMEAHRLAEGIPLVPSVVEDLKALAIKLGVEFPIFADAKK